MADNVRSRGIAIPGIVEKCLSSSRAGTRNKAVEALLLFVEVDIPDPVLVHFPLLNGSNFRMT
jgi:protein STU2